MTNRVSRIFRVFEILVIVCSTVQLGLVCFRLKNDPQNKLNKKLLESINDSGELHMVPAMVHDKFVIRFCVVSQHATEDDMVFAWKVIKQLSVKILSRDRELHRDLSVGKDEEQSDEVFEIQDRKDKWKDDLAHRRSFFVRMVSDPKIYNPKIAGASPGSRRHTHVSSMDEDFNLSANPTGIDEEEEEITTPTSASWVSWPLAFLFQGVFDENSGSNDVPVRFRHLATKVHFKTKRENANRKSPSPECLAIEDDKSDKSDKSPKHTPSQFRRKLLSSNNQNQQPK